MHKQPPATKPSCKCLFQASQQMQQISSAVSHLGSVLSASAIYCPGTGACVATSHKQRYDCAGEDLRIFGTAWDRLGPLGTAWAQEHSRKKWQRTNTLSCETPETNEGCRKLSFAPNYIGKSHSTTYRCHAFKASDPVLRCNLDTIKAANLKNGFVEPYSSGIWWPLSPSVDMAMRAVLARTKTRPKQMWQAHKSEARLIFPPENNWWDWSVLVV
jgi:hypothetical protein